MNEKYALILQQRAAGKILVTEDLYDYRDKTTPEEIYDRIYEIADQHLQQRAPAFNLPDPKLVFDKDEYPTGAARVTPEVVLVKLSYNIIEQLLPLFGDMDEGLDSYITEDIFKALKKSNMTMAEHLVYYTAMLQYYHEFGHLIQDKEKVSSAYKAPIRSAPPAGEVPWTHAREIDADWMSMDQLIKSIVSDFLNDQEQWKKGNIAELEAVLSIALTSTISFFVRAITKELYYAEQTHPHPLIRLELMKRNFGPALRKYLPSSISINETKVIEDAYRFTKGFFEYISQAMNLDENFVLQVKKEVVANLMPINRYIDKMMALASTMDELCMNQEPVTFC